MEIDSEQGNQELYTSIKAKKETQDQNSYSLIDKLISSFYHYFCEKPIARSPTIQIPAWINQSMFTNDASVIGFT